MATLTDTTATGTRVPWVDNIRTASIAGVVVVHTATAYVTDLADWYYHDELHPTSVGFAQFAVPALLGGVFGLGPLFWLAGWFSVGSLRRRGPAASPSTGWSGSACRWRRSSCWSTPCRPRRERRTGAPLVPRSPRRHGVLHHLVRRRPARRLTRVCRSAGIAPRAAALLGA